MVSNQFRYGLDKSSKKFICPQCHKKTFVRYVDNETKDYFHADHVGRCDRDNNCQYHYPPKDYFTKHPSKRPNPVFIKNDTAVIQDIAPSFIPKSHYDYYWNLDASHCTFFQYLIQLFIEGERLPKSGIPMKAAQAISAYQLTPTDNIWIADSLYKDGVIFWQFDYKNRIRTAKIMRYNSNTGKRIKRPKNYINWLHSVLKHQKKIESFNLVQCFFGEHLLTKYPNKPIAIVESEKTACIMSQIIPSHIWLATGGSNGVKWHQAKVYQVLYNREVILYPDLGQFNKWSDLAERLKSVHLNIRCSDLLEKYANDNEKKSGFDIADFAIQNQWYLD